MRSRDRIRQSTFVGHVIMLVGGFMMTVAENRERRFRFGRRKSRFPWGLNRKRGRREGKTGFRHSI